MILDDENILIESAKERATNPMIILKNRVSNRGRFVKEDILIVNEILEDFNKNHSYDWLAKRIKFDIVGNCITVFKNNPSKDRILSIQVISNDDVRISFAYSPLLNTVMDYMVSKYNLKKFGDFPRIYTLDI